MTMIQTFNEFPFLSSWQGRDIWHPNISQWTSLGHFPLGGALSGNVPRPDRQIQHTLKYTMQPSDRAERITDSESVCYTDPLGGVDLPDFR